MARRKPLCAVCGESLAGRRGAKGSVVQDQTRLPGKPSVGWCWADNGNCYDHDKIVRASLENGFDGERERALRVIAKRGEGRVVRNKR